MWLEQVPKLLMEFFFGLSTKDLIEYALLILAGCWGLYLKWKYSQYRLHDRLMEFIAREDSRLNDARVPIISEIRRPEPTRFAYEPIYSNSHLAQALRRVGWRSSKSAERSLACALKLIKERLALAEKSVAVQMEQLATAHFALGSIAASRSDHAQALGEFQQAQRIYKSAPEFLEHVGLQLVKVGNPSEALNYFAEMREVAKRNGDQLAVAWAHRHEAFAHWNAPQKSAWQAQRALKRALQEFPQNAPPLDVASTWELHGKMREERNKLGPAVASFTSALVIYAGQMHRADGKAALERVEAKIAEINKRIADGAVDQLDDDENGDAQLD